MIGAELVIRGILLGVGLAADALAVSMTNGFNEPKMPVKRVALIAAFFGLFQGVMPLIGYFVGAALFKSIEKVIPWISLVILGFLGIKAVKGGLEERDEQTVKRLTVAVLFGQAVATSLDALSVGFTMADVSPLSAAIIVTIIATETFIISFAGVNVGKKFGDMFGNKAEIAGGIILILIGTEIFATKIFF